MVKPLTEAWVAADGKIFTDRAEAEAYEATALRKRLVREEAGRCFALQRISIGSSHALAVMDTITRLEEQGHLRWTFGPPPAVYPEDPLEARKVAIG